MADIHQSPFAKTVMACRMQWQFIVNTVNAWTVTLMLIG
jgi:hypothetical protein